LENLNLLQIHQTWTDLREARVKDGFVFRVSRYFIDHWLCLLGPKAAWAVVDLQQRCYLQKTNFCQVSFKDLCRITGVRSTTTMQALIDTPLMRWFFTKQTTRQLRAGKVVRGKNRYNLQMSDPLTPEHQGQIAWLLENRLRDGTVPTVQNTSDLLRLVSDLPSLSTLPSTGLPAWATRVPLNLRQIVFQVLSNTGLTDIPAKLADETILNRALTDIQTSITQPTRIVLPTHYFRTEWVPHLGATNAWLIMILRSRCYWNKASGEIRDQCVMSNKEIASLLGTSTRTVIRGLQNLLVQKFVTAQERVYERRTGAARKTPASTRYQVLLTMDPLTPPDEAAFAKIISDNAARYGLDPITGQMNMLDILDMMSQLTNDLLSHQKSDKNGNRSVAGERSSDNIEIGRSAISLSPVTSDVKFENREPSQALESPSEMPVGFQNDSNSLTSASDLPLPEAQKDALANVSGDKNEIRTIASAKNEFRNAVSSDKSGTLPPEQSDKIGKQYLSTKDNTNGENLDEQQQYLTVVTTPSTTLFNQLLINYGIEEPALSKINSNSEITPVLINAWILYAESQPSLKNKAAYVVKRLLNNPPDKPSNPDWMLVAELNESEMTNFKQRRSLELRLNANVNFNNERQEAQYQAWVRLFGQEGKLSYDSKLTDQPSLEFERERNSRWQSDIG